MRDRNPALEWASKRLTAALKTAETNVGTPDEARGIALASFIVDEWAHDPMADLSELLQRAQKAAATQSTHVDGC